MGEPGREIGVEEQRRAGRDDEARAEAGSGPIPREQRIDSRTIFDLSGAFDITGRTSLFATVTNLTDEEYNVAFRPAGARPGAPRSWLAGVKLAF